jgi:phosphate:Na+ symporter
LTILINIIGSVALLLWGIRMVRTAVMRSFGAELRSLLAGALSRRFSAFLAGAGITTLLQSSTATSLLVVSFTNSGALSAALGLAILLGADVGTTLVVQIFSQRIEWLSPFFVAIGVISFLSSQNSRVRNLGRGCIGLGLIALALQGISSAAQPLAASDAVQSMLQSGASEPILMVVVVAALTVLVHSSVAIVLLVGTLAAAGALTLHQAFALVIGANLGGAMLPVLATWMQPAAARTPAIANALVRATGVIATLPFIANTAAIAGDFNVAPQLAVAHFHTVFNLALALLALPFIHPIAAFVTSFFQDDAAVSSGQYISKLDDNDFESPAVALACATREALQIGDAVEEMLERTFEVFRDDDADGRKYIKALDDEVDRLHGGIKIYLAKLMRAELSQDESERTIEVLSFATNLEHIGDIIDRNLMVLAAKKKRAKAMFSVEGLKELEEFHSDIHTNMKRAINIFISGDLELARQLLAQKTLIRDKERHSIEQHFERLGKGATQSIDTSSLHLDILRDLKRINSHLTSVAYPILERAGELAESRLRTTDVR